MADTSIFAPTQPSQTTNMTGWNAWYCTLCGVRKPDPTIHTQWHADLAAALKAANPTYTTTQPTVAARLGLTLDFTALLATLTSLLKL